MQTYYNNYLSYKYKPNYNYNPDYNNKINNWKFSCLDQTDSCLDKTVSCLDTVLY